MLRGPQVSCCCCRLSEVRERSGLLFLLTPHALASCNGKKAPKNTRNLVNQYTQTLEASRPYKTKQKILAGLDILSLCIVSSPMDPALRIPSSRSIDYQMFPRLMLNQYRKTQENLKWDESQQLTAPHSCPVPSILKNCLSKQHSKPLANECFYHYLQDSGSFPWSLLARDTSAAHIHSMQCYNKGLMLFDE